MSSIIYISTVLLGILSGIMVAIISVFQLDFWGIATGLSLVLINGFCLGCFIKLKKIGS